MLSSVVSAPLSAHVFRLKVPAGRHGAPPRLIFSRCGAIVLGVRVYEGEGEGEGVIVPVWGLRRRGGRVLAMCSSSATGRSLLKPRCRALPMGCIWWCSGCVAAMLPGCTVPGTAGPGCATVSDEGGYLQHSCWTYWGHSGAPRFDAAG